MIQTILLLVLIGALALFLAFTAIKTPKLSTRAILLWTTAFLVSILILLLSTGIEKIKSDLSRLINNSLPKDAETVYAVLLGKPVDTCVNIINFKDQVIPQIDCCVWMEIQLCPAELKRIISAKNYTTVRLDTSDSLNFLKSFQGRPIWWTPQRRGDNLLKYIIKWNQDKEQTFFVSPDSMHAYICDRAQ